MSRTRHTWTGTTPAELEAERRAYLRELIQHVDPTAPLSVIDEVLTSLISNRIRLHRTAFRLREHPGDLTAGSLHPLIQDLVLALRAAGVHGLVSPACPACGRATIKLDRSHPAGGRQCQRCSARAHTEPCSQCGREQRVVARRDGHPWCGTCYAHDTAEECQGCGKTRPVKRHTTTGAICGTCARKDPSAWRDCIGCGRSRPVNQHTPDGPLCLTCYKQQRPDRPWPGTREQRRQAQADLVIAAVHAVDPTATRAVILTAVDTVADYHNRRAALATYIRDHPDALVSGDNTAPLVIGQLIATLAAAGVTGMTRPVCEDCSAAADLVHNRADGHRICIPCYVRTHTEVCGDCGQVRPVAQRLSTGQARCGRCTDQRRPPEPCTMCGRVMGVADRLGPDGGPRCSRCRRRDTTTWRPCSSCGQTRPIAKRVQRTGAPLCPACYQPPTATCDLCGQDGPIRSRKPGFTICVRCYRGRWHPCHDCHATTWAYLHEGEIRCLRCILTAKLTTLITGPDGHPQPEWIPLRDLLADAPHPRTQLRWLRRSEAARLVEHLCREEQGPSHQLLDDAAGERDGNAAAIEHLRALLVAVGALEARDPHLARLENRLHRLVDQAHPDDRKLLQRYIRWDVLTRTRSHARGRITVGTASGRLAGARAAAHFLDWLRDHEATLESATQAHLDLYRASHPPRGERIRPFLGWARRHHLNRTFTLPENTYRPPRRRLPSTARRHLLERALTEPDWPVRDRAAALLLLLYGLAPARIVQLTRDHLTLDADGTVTALTIGTHPIGDLPPAVAALLGALPGRDRDGAAAAALSPTEPSWLFPGDRPGHHLDPTTLAGLLRRRGIKPRLARNTAMAELAVDLPVPVVSKILGVSTATAEHWAHSQGFSPNYAAEIWDRTDRKRR